MKQVNNINILSAVNSNTQANDLFSIFMMAVEMDYENIKLAHNTGMAIELISPTIDTLYIVPSETSTRQQEVI